MTSPPAPAPSAEALDALPASVQTLIGGTGHLYASRDWLRVEEQVATEPPLYAWVDGDSAGDGDGHGDGAGAGTGAGRGGADGDGTAFAAAYRFDADSNPWPYARLDLFLRQLGLGEVEAEAVLPAYLLGGRRPGHSRVLTTGRPAARAALLTRLVGHAAEAAAARGAASLAALYCDRSDDDLAAAFAAHGGVRVDSYTSFVLDLPGSSWDDWLASLPRKRRQNEIHDSRKLAESGVHYSIAPLTHADIDWIVPLELDLYSKYGNDYLVDEARALHRAYLDRLGPDALLLRAERDGAPVGFVSLVRKGDTLYLRQAGFDQEACAGTPVYFGAVFHAAVQWAYAHGITSVDYSISADEVKLRRGCRALERDAWILPLSQGARDALRALR
ncbi:GNAT family N-acetyltransferase [Streptomyces sp. NPDC053541]|uniref:GNAT family N-acetyltransferase n=1 Tax=Streptomyces sp. NPDC053541 TaxID=3365709 RepID=UPI0037D46D08